MRQPLAPPPQQTDFFGPDGKLNNPWLQWFIAIVNLFSANAQTGVPVTTDTTPQAGDILLVDTTVADVNINFPLAASAPFAIVRITKISTDPNSVNFVMAGADTLNGAPGGSIATAYQAVAYISDGVSQWVNVV